MLHNEAQKLLVKGYEKGGSVEAIAQAYSVGERTVYRLAQQKRETGSVALRTSQHGRKPALTEEDKKNINQCAEERADITIDEIWEKLQLRVSYSTVGRAVQAMGYTLKKKSVYTSERDRLRCGGRAEKMGRAHNT